MHSSVLMMEKGASCLSCQERQIVEDLKNQSELHLKEGKLYFLISTRWYRSWERYGSGGGGGGGGGDEPCIDSQQTNGISSKGAKRPGPIENSNIIENSNGSEGDDLQVCRNLEEGQDYVLVPQQAWEKLFLLVQRRPSIAKKDDF